MKDRGKKACARHGPHNANFHTFGVRLGARPRCPGLCPNLQLGHGLFESIHGFGEVVPSGQGRHRHRSRLEQRPLRWKHQSRLLHRLSRNLSPGLPIGYVNPEVEVAHLLRPMVFHPPSRDAPTWSNAFVLTRTHRHPFRHRLHRFHAGDPGGRNMGHRLDPPARRVHGQRGQGRRRP